jgi:hypothetical protein
MSVQWINDKGIYFMSPPIGCTKVLPVGVYVVGWNDHNKRYELNKSMDSFSFDYKIYNLDTPFIDRVLKTHDNTTNNLGILLYGVRGTGKTVTAKIICNRLNMPVLIVRKEDSNLSTLLSEIQQEVIVLIDEFEKIYRDETQKHLLSLMDGVMQNKHRRVFILTSNSLRINENFIQRPGRIRYKKEYKDLDLETITEVVNDMLINKELNDGTIDYISQLEMITIDIVKAVLNEVNIHNEDPKMFSDVFNATKKTLRYNVWKITDRGEELMEESADTWSMTKGRFTEQSVGNNLEYIHFSGRITEVHAPLEISICGNYNKQGLGFDNDTKTAVLVRVRYKAWKPRHAAFKTKA